MIETAVIILASVSLGFLMGRGKSPETDLQTLEKLVKEKGGEIHLIPTTQLQPGVIRRPTAQQLNRLNEPDTIKQSKEAMKETLDQVPELQEAKKIVEQKKAAGTWIP